MSLITATIPTFRNFLKSLSTGFGFGGLSNSGGYGYGSEGRTRLPSGSKGGKMGSSYQPSRLRSAIKSVAISEPGEEEPSKNNPYNPQHRPARIDPLTAREGGSAATAHWSAGTSSSDGPGITLRPLVSVAMKAAG